MIKLNTSILVQILAATPHFRYESDVITNIKEMMQNIKDDTVDALDQEYISVILSMVDNINRGIDVDNEGLIRLSTVDEKMAVDITVRTSRMNDESLEYIRKLVDSFVMRIPALRASERLSDAIEAIQKSPNNKLINSFDNLYNVVNTSITEIEDKKSSINTSTLVFGRRGKNGIRGMNNVITKLRHEDTFKLSSGIPAIDDLTGLYKPQKLYWVTALSGGFKSGFLENCTLGMSRSNPNLPKVEGKENAILHVTFENDTLQVYKRMIDYHQTVQWFSNKNLNKMSDEDIISMAEDILVPKNDTDLSIIIKHVARRTMDVQGLRNTIKALNRDGYNICALLVDYCELMKNPPVSKFEETNDATPVLVRKAESLKLLAQDFGIPVISAGQFNRPGEDIVKSGIATRMASPLYSALSAAHLAGGFGIKYHVESSIFLYRGMYDGVDLLHMKVDKSRDGLAKDDSSNKDKKAKSQYRFCKFKSNMFAISPDPKDCYYDIADVCPDNEENSIINNAFSSVEASIQIDIEKLNARTEAKNKALESIL